MPLPLFSGRRSPRGVGQLRFVLSLLIRYCIPPPPAPAANDASAFEKRDLAARLERFREGRLVLLVFETSGEEMTFNFIRSLVVKPSARSSTVSNVNHLRS
jgi:hypothetical protein